jgi:hypothetical protein
MLPPTNVEDGWQNDARHRVPLKRLLPPLIRGSAAYPGLGRVGGRPLCHVVFPRMPTARSEIVAMDGVVRSVVARE